MGDFNADIFRNDRFGRSLLDMLHPAGLRLEDIHRLPRDTFTFFSTAHHSVSWLDHVVTSPSAAIGIHNVSVLPFISESDHMPLIVRATVSSLQMDPSMELQRPAIQRTDCRKFTLSERNIYLQHTEQLTTVLNTLSLCTVQGCTNTKHLNDIDVFCTTLEEGLCRAANSSRSLLPRQPKARLLPGWNTIAKDKHRTARTAFHNWVSNGRPAAGDLFEHMTASRKDFKHSVKRCKQLQRNREEDRLLGSLLRKNHKQFWTDVKKMSPRDVKSTTVDGISGDGNIASHWGSVFSRLLGEAIPSTCNCVTDLPTNTLEFTAAQCKEACASLNSAATPGLDGVSVSSFRLASPKVYDALAWLFNAMLAHSHIPHSVSDSFIIPIPKGSLADLDHSSSYRGITITSTISKILEAAAARSLASYLRTSPTQFGFKTGHSTMDAVFLLKEVVAEYNTQGSPVYACFLDLQKAFDSVDHQHLLHILLRRGLPANFVHLLRAWFTNQRMAARWGSAESSWFAIRRGVRQGGCLSPVLFNIFLDEVLCKLQASRNGCTINGLRVNVLAYADDIVLLAPTLNALQELARLCSSLLSDIHLTVNANKTECMAFLPTTPGRLLKREFVRHIFINGTALRWSSSVKYLGTILSPDGSSCLDMSRARRTFLGSANVIVRRFSRYPLAVQQRLYSAFCYGFYGAELWNSNRASDMHLLEVTVHSASKRLLRRSNRTSSRLACLELNILPIAQLILSKRLCFLRRCLESSNPLVQGAIHGVRWSLSPFLRDTNSLCLSWGLSRLNFARTSFGDLSDMFLWDILRSLTSRPPHQWNVD